MTTDMDFEQVARDAADALRKRFPDRPDAEIDRIVHEELGKLRDRPVQDYLSILTERAARKRLKADQG